MTLGACPTVHPARAGLFEWLLRTKGMEQTDMAIKRELKQFHVMLVLLVVSVLISFGAFAAEIDQQGFSDADGFDLAVREDGLTISWDAKCGGFYLEYEWQHIC